MNCSSCKRPIPEGERERALVLPRWTTCALCRGTRFPVPGHELGPWLGKRGEFDVFEARTAAGERCAVCLWPDAIWRGETFDPGALERNLPKLAALGAPVVRVLSWGCVGRSLYYVEELPGGVFVKDLVSGRGPVAVDGALTILGWVARVFDQVAAAWPWARLTPDQVLVLPGGRLKLSVFTMTPFVGALQAGRGHVGGGVDTTIGFLSPEAAEDGSVATPGSRVYAAGALAYYLLSGEPPFVERTTLGYFRKIRNEAPRALGEVRPDVPAALSALVARCLKKKPEERPRDLAALAAELAQVRPTP